MKKYLVLFLGLTLGFSSLAPIIVSAQTSNFQAQLDMINQLTKQIQDLQNQILALQQKSAQLQVEQQKQVGELIRSLKQGSTGQDVKILQALLAANSDVYPEGLITGLYGPLTAKAVRKFQSKHGIEQAGVVGPKTLKKLNEFLRENPIAFQVSAASIGSSTASGRNHDNDEDKNSEGHEFCAIVPPGHLIAKGWLKKNDKPIVPICQTLPRASQSKSVTMATPPPPLTPLLRPSL
ncbi:MAG: peptidoglycan-binding protein [Candidatus Liptonbacteria bacterium]|nr:peptidoglycan-binding protein [Candidatus Liptonbacteria bacterium]